MHVLSVSSLKGGVGKTTIALGLASAALSRGLRTLVVDLDSQCDASTGLGVKEDSSHTVLDVLKNPRHSIVTSSIVVSTWADGRTGKLDVMVGSTKAADFDTITPNVRDLFKLDHALAEVENQYDLVIIDTPPSLNGLLRTAWVASERVLLVTEPGIFSVGAIERAIRAIHELHDELNRKLAPVGVVANRVLPNFTEHTFRLRELSERAGSALLEVQVSERAAMQQAQGAARAIHSWPGEGASEMARAFDSLLEVVQNSFAEPVTRAKRSRVRKAEKGGLFKKKAKVQHQRGEDNFNLEDLIN